jgi:hypothetical protein
MREVNSGRARDVFKMSRREHCGRAVPRRLGLSANAKHRQNANE